MVGVNRESQAVAFDTVCRDLDGIVGEMGMAAGGSDPGGVRPGTCAWLAKAVAQVTDAHVFKPDALRICPL